MTMFRVILQTFNDYVMIIPQIRVNSVNPTVVKTAMTKWVWGDPDVLDKVCKSIPLRHFAGNVLCNYKSHKCYERKSVSSFI